MKSSQKNSGIPMRERLFRALTPHSAILAELERQIESRKEAWECARTAWASADAAWKDAQQAWLESNQAGETLCDALAENARLKQRIADSTERLQTRERECGLLHAVLAPLSEGDYEGAYECVAPELDPEGFALHRAAQEYTGKNVCFDFPVEDGLGYFESLNGHELLNWLEAETFGTYDLEERAPGVLVACNLKINRDSEGYREYRRAICKKAVMALLTKGTALCPVCA